MEWNFIRFLLFSWLFWRRLSSYTQFTRRDKLYSSLVVPIETRQRWLRSRWCPVALWFYSRCVTCVAPYDALRRSFGHAATVAGRDKCLFPDTVQLFTAVNGNWQRPANSYCSDYNNDKYIGALGQEHALNLVSPIDTLRSVVAFRPWTFLCVLWATGCILSCVCFLGDRSKTVRPMPSDRCPVCLHVCPVCDVGVLWPNGWMDQDKTWHAGRPQPQPHCVSWHPSSPPQKKRGGSPPPNFRPMPIVCIIHHLWHWMACNVLMCR